MYVIKKKERIRKEFSYTERRNMKRYNVDIFKNTIANDPHWLQYWSANSVTEMWDIMNEIILDSLNQILPKGRICICTNNPEWFTSISQMPITGRLLEKAIHAQLSYYINSTGLLHINQHGLRTGKSRSITYLLTL